MALSNNPVFAQTPKTAGIAFGTGTNTTVMDPSTVAPTTLLTAGADGALVTSIKCYAEATATAEKFVLWVQPLGAGSWYMLDEALMAAYTQAATTVQGDTLLVDKTNPDDTIRLAGTDVLGVTHHVDQQSIVTAEYTNY